MQNLKLNLKHLRYFWAVATHGSIARAAETMFLTPQTISGQLRELEEQVDAKLFQRDGRQLVLTETGRMVFSYADEMFRLGLELQDVLAGRTPGTAITVKVGIAMIVPKLLTYRVLEPVLQMPESVRLVCHEAPLVDLLADLWAFMRERKKFWLAPIILVMILLGALIVFAQGSSLAPFIYTLF